MKIALCQLDPRVGDFEENKKRALAAAEKARALGAELAVFGELAVCGYPARDLLDRPSFVEADFRARAEIIASLPRDLVCVFGALDKAQDGAGRPITNAAFAVKNGEILARAHKMLLPTYDVFDDARHFEPGSGVCTFEHRGRRFGITICEDIWNDEPTNYGRHYARNPVAEVVAAGADVILNVSASPFTLSKSRERPAMFANVARRHGKPVVFANQVGGFDDLIFDGCSGAWNAKGEEIARAHAFAEDVLVFDLEAGGELRAKPSSDEEAAFDALVLGTRDYARKCGFKSAVLGLSGGIDSALVAAIAKEALGAENVVGVAMPTRYSSEHSRVDARVLAENLGIGFHEVHIDGIFGAYLRDLGPALDAIGEAPQGDVTFENVQSRIRCGVLMGVSNRAGHLLLTTGNKSEVAVGYCTLYGDMAGGLAVIADLPKTFVYRVSRYVNERAGREVIPESTLTKPPSAELRPDQTDQDSLPPYDVLDAILERYVEHECSLEDLLAEGFDEAIVRRVLGLVAGAEHKRKQMPPGLIVTRKAFGSGRRVPLAKRWK